MEISLNSLAKAFEKAGYPVQITINISQNEPYIGILAGSDMNGSLNIFLGFKEIADILEANNVTGENGRLQQLLKEARENNHKRRELDERMDEVIYGTLQKYIYQMLKAAINKNFFPELVPLKHHREAYWPR